MNHLYRDLIYNLAGRVVRDAESVQRLVHSGLKGHLRELFIKELLQPMIPSEYVIGSGNIITACNEISNQIDVVVCERRIIPPLLFQDNVGVFPIESALLTIEVKSILDLDELRTAHISAVKVAHFRHSVRPSDSIEHLIPCLFAFNTDLSREGKSEISRYLSITGDADPALRMICVVGRGCWFWNNGSWFNWEFPGVHGEIVAFLVGIANRIQDVAGTRISPDIREYVLFNHAEDVGRLTPDACGGPISDPAATSPKPTP